MQIKFKNKPQCFASSMPFEQRIYQNGEPSGWLLSLTLKGDFNSAVIDELLTTDSISEITFILSDTDDESGSKTTVLTGYARVISCVVRYTGDGVTAEIQLTKGV